MTSYSDLRNIATDLAKQAGSQAKSMRKEATASAATKSSPTDIVTAGDKAAEQLIVDSLKQLRPNDGLEGEEGTSSPGTSGVTWHIDPIDGTTNYVYGLPYCVSVAAEKDAVMVAGAVYAPQADELFSASIGEGATCNGAPITTRPVENLQAALLGTGFSYQAAKRTEQAIRLTKVIDSVRDIRRVGACALDLCMVAAGRLDAYYEENLNLWDFAAGALIAAEAGATVTDNAGDAPTTKFLVAANSSIHKDLLLLIQNSDPQS